MKKKVFNYFQFLGVVVVLLLLHPLAQAVDVSAKLDRNSAVVGETVTLVLQTNDTDQSLDTDLSVLQTDFEVLDRRSETQMSFVNGRQTAFVRLVITLEPKRAGTLLIPSLNFPGASSAPLELKVSAAPVSSPGEPEPVFVEVRVQPVSGPYFVHAQIGLLVRIFYQTNLTEAAINPPAPELASVRLLDEVPYQAERDGIQYRVLERRYAIFPERSGELVIPPMQLTGRLIERPSDRLWQPTVRGRRVRVQSDPVVLEIKPRPAAYTGKFWLPARRLTMSQKISDSEKLHVGEPVTRTVIIDAVGLEENMLEEPSWPDMPDTRIYPDQPQGISRDDGEWVLGHKEFRYAIVPETTGDLVLPEIRLDWWDSVSNRQRTAILPQHRVSVLPSELNPAVGVMPHNPAEVPGVMDSLSAAEVTRPGKAALIWQTATAVFAALWLFTLVFYIRRGRNETVSPKINESISQDEKALLKKLQKACHRGDAAAARKLMSQWVRNFAPNGMQGSMRDFAVASENRALQQAIDHLDVSGFTRDPVSDWKGDSLWAALKDWRRQTGRYRNNTLGDQPDLYRRWT